MPTSSDPQRRNRRSQLFPLFRSDTQAELLTVLYVSGLELSITDLAGRIGRVVSFVQREVGRLEDAGLVRTRRVGRNRMVRANTESPLFDAVNTLVTHTHGPRLIVADELRYVAGIDEAWIFGSWAARYAGESGPAPADIDVLVIGTPDPDDLWDATRRASRRLGRDVSARVVPAERWAESRDPFLIELQSRPRVKLELEAA